MTAAAQPEYDYLRPGLLRSGALRDDLPPFAEAVARRWLADENLSGAEVLFVGDSEHDFEIAEAVGARCVLFSGGHHARVHLESLGAPVIDDLRDVPAVVSLL